MIEYIPEEIFLTIKKGTEERDVYLKALSLDETRQITSSAKKMSKGDAEKSLGCLLYTSPSPRDS